VVKESRSKYLKNNIPSPVLDLMIATNQSRLPATTKSWPLFGTEERSTGSGESLMRVRLFTSLIDRNCDEVRTTKCHEKATHIWGKVFSL